MILLALGSNLRSAAGPPAGTLSAALATLKPNGIRPLKVSRFYETLAWPDPRQPSFVNAAAQVETALEPRALLARLHEIESLFGRTREQRNAPRTLDLDILDYRGMVAEGPPALPHPRMQSRGFVLVPLAEIAPEWRHPASGLSITQLIAALPGKGRDARPLSSAPPIE